MKSGIVWVAFIGLVGASGCQTPPFNMAGSNKRDFNEARLPAFSEAGDDGKQAARTSLSPPSTVPSANEAAGPAAAAPAVRNDSVRMKWVEEELRRGAAAYAQGQLAQAKIHYVRVVEREPDNATAHHQLAIIADREEDFTVAEGHYRQALKSRHNDPDIFSDLGWSYILQGKYNEAEEMLLTARVFNRNHRKALDRLGYLYGKIYGDYDRAWEMFSQGNSPAKAQENIALIFPQGRPPTRSSNHPAQRIAADAPFGAPTAPGGMGGFHTASGTDSAGRPAGPITGTPSIVQPPQWPAVPASAPSFQNHSPPVASFSQPQVPDYASFPGSMNTVPAQPLPQVLPGLPVGQFPRGDVAAPVLNGAGSSGPSSGLAAATMPSRVPPAPTGVASAATGLDPAAAASLNAPNPLDAMPFFPEQRNMSAPGGGSPVNTAAMRPADAATPFPHDNGPSVWPPNAGAPQPVQPAAFQQAMPAVEQWPFAPAGATSSSAAAPPTTGLVPPAINPGKQPTGAWPASNAGATALPSATASGTAGLTPWGGNSAPPAGSQAPWNTSPPGGASPSWPASLPSSQPGIGQSPYPPGTAAPARPTEAPRAPAAGSLTPGFATPAPPSAQFGVPPPPVPTLNAAGSATAGPPTGVPTPAWPNWPSTPAAPAVPALPASQYPQYQPAGGVSVPSYQAPGQPAYYPYPPYSPPATYSTPGSYSAPSTYSGSGTSSSAR